MAFGAKNSESGFFFRNLDCLKKIASILLLFILLFSLYGYRLLISSLMEKADRDLDARLNEKSYDDSQLISFKVPITRLSYYNPSSQWERIEGSIDIGNVFYKYVKRRIVDDSLEVLCIPHSTATELQEMKRQASHPMTSKVPEPEPYVFTALNAVAPPTFKIITNEYYFSIFMPQHPRGTEERPPLS